MININVNSIYPTTDEVYSHELNTGGSKKINIAFWQDSIPVDLSEKLLSATFVCNKRLIAEDVELEKINDNIAQLDISSTENYRILPGTMLVEIKIAEGNKELYPSSALVIKVRRSIIDDAEVTPESYGTVSEILQEVAEARGNFASLVERLDDVDDKFEEADGKFDDVDDKFEEVDGKFDDVDDKFDNVDTSLLKRIEYTEIGPQTSNTAFDSLISTKKIYHLFHRNTTNEEYIEYLVWFTNVIQFRLSFKGLEYRKLLNNVWEVWTYAIADNSVTYNALSIALQEIIDGKVDVSDIEDCMYYTSDTISSVSALNVNAYASEFIKYGLILTSSAATAFGVPSGTKAEMTVTSVGTVSSNNPAIRCITFPGISGLKWYQEVTSIGQTFTAGSWTRVNVRDEVVLKPNITIGFDSNGCIAQIINVLGTTLGAGYGSNIRAIYINSSITTVSDDVFTTAPYLNSLYIDNVPGAVTFGETIQTKIANREFSVIYRDSINLVRSLAISQKGTYERLIGLLPNYSIGFNSNGIVITRANVTDIGAGGIGNSNVRSIYVAPKVTSISSSIISATIGLTTDTLDLYVDNSQDNINIASEVLSDSRITIHYKGSFSVIDLLLNSQLQLNDRVTTLENTIGGLINGDEVSY